MQLHTLLGMEAVDMHMHCICTFLRFTCIEVLCWHEVEMRSIVFIVRSITLFTHGDGLFMVYHALYSFMEILLDILHIVVYFFMTMSLDK